MTKEKLLEWGLTEEQAKKVMESLDGAFVTKTRFNEVNGELKAARDTIKERDRQLDELKKSGADAATLQEQITRLQTENAEKDKAHAAELKALWISNAVELALSAARAKNNTAARALLAGFIKKADIAEDGTVKGLEGEVRKLVEGKDTAFLFESAAEKKFKGARAAEKSDHAGDPAGMTLEKLRAMTPMERHDFSINHPDEYRQLYNNV